MRKTIKLVIPEPAEPESLDLYQRCAPSADDPIWGRPLVRSKDKYLAGPICSEPPPKGYINPDRFVWQQIPYELQPIPLERLGWQRVQQDGCRYWRKTPEPVELVDMAIVEAIRRRCPVFFEPRVELEAGI